MIWSKGFLTFIPQLLGQGRWWWRVWQGCRPVPQIMMIQTLLLIVGLSDQGLSVMLNFQILILQVCFWMNSPQKYWEKILGFIRHTIKLIKLEIWCVMCHSWRVFVKKFLPYSILQYKIGVYREYPFHRYHSSWLKRVRIIGSTVFNVIKFLVIVLGRDVNWGLHWRPWSSMETFLAKSLKIGLHMVTF